MNRKNIYIHIPKNAGTFVKSFINDSQSDINSIEGCNTIRLNDSNGDCSKVHKTYIELNDEINIENIDKYKNNFYNYFTIIRNPYKRFESIYEYDKDFLKKFLDTNYSNFDEFLDYLFKNPKKIYSHKHLYPQIDFIKNNNNFEVDILLFEDIPYNLRNYCHYKKMNYHIHKFNDIINEGIKRNNNYWNDDNIMKFNKLYWEDIKFYNKFNKLLI
jgi:hypothetical protein